MILTRTPYRVSLFGGGSDYPEHFNEHGGAVLGMAINRYAYLGVKRMPPGQASRYRVVYSIVDDTDEIEKIKHPAVRGCLQHLCVDTPLEIQYAGDLASGGGLGASSAFVVGLLHALLWQLFPQAAGARLPCNLAEEAILVERTVINEAVGCQDQTFAAHGGLRFIRFAAQAIETKELFLSEERQAELERSLVLVYSGTMRFAHVMAAKQLTRVEQNADVLRSMAALATAARDLLLDEHEPLSTIGMMLHATWNMKRALHPEVSNRDIDALYERGRALGALGGKLCGAGGGGFLLFFVPPGKRESFELSIGAPCVGFKIAQQGTHVLVNEP